MMATQAEWSEFGRPPAADRKMANEIGESGQEIPNYEFKDNKKLSTAEGSQAITFVMTRDTLIWSIPGRVMVEINLL